MSQNPFGPDVIAAISRHMNDDHATDALVIVRGLGDTPDATAFARPLTERPEIRAEIVRLHTEAATALGIDPRTESRTRSQGGD